ncbi:MAG: ComF family protein [Candidatus Chromulinivorax sp.]
MNSFFSLLYTFFTYLLAPPFCLHCKQSLQLRSTFCKECQLLILPIVPFDLYIGSKTIVTVFAMSAYKDPLRALILSKHQGNETNIKMLADVMATSAVLERLDFDMVTFIPLHWTRYAARGFNQAEIIANTIGKATGKPVMQLLKRSKRTQFQARLAGQQRQANVQDAFAVYQKNKNYIGGKKILLVDDLFTTGATVQAAAKILMEHDPVDIKVFVACRVTNA